jgi:membrane fusion protein (multidrug efflux system)
MFGRVSSTLGSAAVSFLVSVVHSGPAAAQAPAPPPAVTVSPVVSHQVTETADFVGRVVAINKVDIVAQRTIIARTKTQQGPMIY